MATGSNHRPWTQGAGPRTADRRGSFGSLIVGGLVVVAAIVALLAYGRTMPGARDVGTTASAPVTTSPPTDHPAVTEPTRPTPLPPR